MGGTPQPVEMCNLRVSATDPFGAPIKDFELELRSREYQLIRGNPVSHEFENVPFGEYVLVARNDCCRLERMLIVNVPRLWVRIAVPVRFGDSIAPGGYLSVEGEIRSRSRVAVGHWARIRGVFLDFSREVQIDSTGRVLI
jgi:hypothetical protein